MLSSGFARMAKQQLNGNLQINWLGATVNAYMQLCNDAMCNAQYTQNLPGELMDLCMWED
jgi:hypothetical protein